MKNFKEDCRLGGQKKNTQVGHLRKFFDGYRAIDVTAATIKRYISHSREQGIAKATINRELAALKRMFNLSAKETPLKANRVPYIPMQKEDNVKEGLCHAD